MRLDERIQQLFSIMNKILKQNPNTYARNLAIKQFQILPITNRLGVLEWVKNTQPLKQIMQNVLRFKDLNKMCRNLLKLELMIFVNVQGKLRESNGFRV